MNLFWDAFQKRILPSATSNVFFYCYHHYCVSALPAFYRLSCRRRQLYVWSISLFIKNSFYLQLNNFYCICITRNIVYCKEINERKIITRYNASYNLIVLYSFVSAMHATWSHEWTWTWLRRAQEANAIKTTATYQLLLRSFIEWSTTQWYKKSAHTFTTPVRVWAGPQLQAYRMNISRLLRRWCRILLFE